MVLWYDALCSLYFTSSIFTLQTALRRVILFGLAAIVHTHAWSNAREDIPTRLYVVGHPNLPIDLFWSKHRVRRSPFSITLNFLSI